MGAGASAITPFPAAIRGQTVDKALKVWDLDARNQLPDRCLSVSKEWMETQNFRNRTTTSFQTLGLVISVPGFLVFFVPTISWDTRHCAAVSQAPGPPMTLQRAAQQESIDHSISHVEPEDDQSKGQCRSEQLVIALAFS